MSQALIDSWQALRSLRPVGRDEILTEPLLSEGAETALRLAVDAAGLLHLLIPVSGPSSRPMPPDYHGLRLSEGILDDLPCMDLCAPAAHEKMFATLCEELIGAVLVQQRDPWAAATAILRSWQSAWRPVRQPMTRSVQIGLAGELLVMHALWLPAVGAQAVHFWSGPERERHDFTSPRLHMEVKATTRSRHEHEISRIDQLQVPDERRLMLASVQLEESAQGSLSVASLIDQTLDAIRADTAAADAFLTRLDGLDWSDDMRRSPDLLRFHLRDAQIFEVDDDFPQLPADLILPDGVVAIRYTISLANLPWLDVAEVRDDIAAACVL